MKIKLVKLEVVPKGWESVESAVIPEGLTYEGFASGLAERVATVRGYDAAIEHRFGYSVVPVPSIGYNNNPDVRVHVFAL
jgi:hypothetical protein